MQKQNFFNNIKNKALKNSARGGAIITFQLNKNDISVLFNKNAKALFNIQENEYSVLHFENVEKAKSVILENASAEQKEKIIFKTR